MGNGLIQQNKGILQDGKKGDHRTEVLTGHNLLVKNGCPTLCPVCACAPIFTLSTNDSVPPQRHRQTCWTRVSSSASLGSLQDRAEKCLPTLGTPRRHSPRGLGEHMTETHSRSRMRNTGQMCQVHPVGLGGLCLPRPGEIQITMKPRSSEAPTRSPNQ